MPELETFQDAFSAALRRESSAIDAWLKTPDDPGLDVYRNTITAGAVDALASIFPTVSALVVRGGVKLPHSGGCVLHFAGGVKIPRH